jgi:hypothetical protein
MILHPSKGHEASSSLRIQRRGLEALQSCTGRASPKHNPQVGTLAPVLMEAIKEYKQKRRLISQERAVGTGFRQESRVGRLVQHPNIVPYIRSSTLARGHYNTPLLC